MNPLFPEIHCRHVFMMVRTDCGKTILAGVFHFMTCRINPTANHFFSLN